MPFKTKKTDYWQYDIVVRGHRLRGSTGTKDFEEAKDIEAQIRADATAKKSKGTDFTLSEALGTYFRDVSQHQPSHYTTDRYAHVLIDDMRGALDEFSTLSGGVPQYFPQNTKLTS